MFSNFKKAFVKRPQFTIAPPKAVIDVLNLEAPEGFEYKHTGDGICVLVNEKEFVVNNGKIILPADVIEKYGEQFKDNIEAVLQYAYNSQMEIIIAPKDDGCYVINGKKIRAEDLIKAPLKGLNLKENRLVMSPQKFPGPFLIVVEGNGQVLELFLERKAHKSIDTYLLETVEGSPLELIYKYNATTESCTFTITINKNIKSVSEVLKVNQIYNSFIEGTVKINGVEADYISNKCDATVSEETLLFWKMLQALERKLKVSFDASQDILISDVNKVNELYSSFIEKKPFRQYKTYKNLRVSGREYKIEKFSELIGHRIFFEYVEKEKCELLGVHLVYEALVGIYDAVIDKIIHPAGEKTDEFQIDISSEVDRKMYSSTMYFVTEDELNLYREKEGHIEEFADSKEITYIKK